MKTKTANRIRVIIRFVRIYPAYLKAGAVILTVWAALNLALYAVDALCGC